MARAETCEELMMTLERIRLRFSALVQQGYAIMKTYASVHTYGLLHISEVLSPSSCWLKQSRVSA